MSSIRKKLIKLRYLLMMTYYKMEYIRYLMDIADTYDGSWTLQFKKLIVAQARRTDPHPNIVLQLLQ